MVKKRGKSRKSKSICRGASCSCGRGASRKNKVSKVRKLIKLAKLRRSRGKKGKKSKR